MIELVPEETLVMCSEMRSPGQRRGGGGASIASKEVILVGACQLASGKGSLLFGSSAADSSAWMEVLALRKSAQKMRIKELFRACHPSDSGPFIISCLGEAAEGLKAPFSPLSEIVEQF